MLTARLLALTPQMRWLIRLVYGVLLVVFVVVSMAFVTVLNEIDYATNEILEPIATPFPLGVDPVAEAITPQPDVEAFREAYVAQGPRRPARDNWRDRLVGLFAQIEQLQNLALSSSRVLVIYAGERKEEVARNFGGILRWSGDERQVFLNTVTAAFPEQSEGMFLPGKYVVDKDAAPEAVAQMIIDSFNREVVRRYPADIDAVVPFTDALIIASLLEREAYDFTDMREISGVIWNRLFIDMPLQLDATLQYAKGSQPIGPWWPKPVPSDKWLDSPYNTYQNKGLPPGPIANVSVEAILAALNPVETDCLFYLHAAGGAFYCSPTYEGHQANINTYLR